MAELLAAMDACGIERVCLSGLGIGQGRAEAAAGAFGLGSLSPGNPEVLAAFRQYPTRIIPVGAVQLGRDGAKEVYALRESGFRALKITRPAVPYNDDLCLPVYAAAEELGLPILFHTGMVLVTPFDAEDDVDSNRMRPMQLDRAARRFPELRLVLAHMGMPWLEEAATMARFHPNVYIDITAAPNGWRSQLRAEEFRRLLFWEGAFSKIVFGTDVLPGLIGGAVSAHEELFDKLGLPEAVRADVLYKNALKLLGEL